VSGLEYIAELIKRIVDIEVLIRWIYEKMVNEYGVDSIEVKRVRDAVIIVVRGKSEKELDNIESELRRAVAALGFGEKVDVDVDVEVE